MPIMNYCFYLFFKFINVLFKFIIFKQLLIKTEFIRINQSYSEICQSHKEFLC